MNDLLFALLFFLPASIANMAPIFANNIPGLAAFDTPIDRGRTYNGVRVLGDHKTFRGLGAGAVGGLVGGAVQMVLYINSSFVRDVSVHVDYSNWWVLALGVVMGLGALAGDSVKSFFKRQRGVAPGKGWFPFDQTDYIIGAALCSLPFVVAPLSAYIIGVATALILHPVVNIIGWLLKLKPNPL